jgi:hypothetical protein
MAAPLIERKGVVTASPSFRGNKAHLPSKPCTVCGRPMVWRRAWAKNWAEVKVCSQACRLAGRKRHG